MKKNLLLLAPMLFPAAAAAQGHYNIVYIMTDDHTAQMMSCLRLYGLSESRLCRFSVRSRCPHSRAAPRANTHAVSTAKTCYPYGVSVYMTAYIDSYRKSCC